MLPTPSTSHVLTDRVYEPSEDSYLLMDALSSEQERQWLEARFARLQPESVSCKEAQTPSPIVMEIGTGSGVVLAFLTAHASTIFGRPDIFTIGADVSHHASSSTAKTVTLACREARKPQDEYSRTLGNAFLSTPPSESEEDQSERGRGTTWQAPSEPVRRGKAQERAQPAHGVFLDATDANLMSAMRDHSVDILLFNPPYVPSEAVPCTPLPDHHQPSSGKQSLETKYSVNMEQANHFLALATDGGEDGMEVTTRFLDDLPRVLNAERGTCYILLCARNKPQEVMDKINEWNLVMDEHMNGPGRWDVEIIKKSGFVAGWEKLCILRIWRTEVKETEVR